ncbi:MAG TPA: protein YgfX [Nevskiaceae bacterium]|nr:protein YgfX [Nevskiaceae bacterium]
MNLHRSMRGLQWVFILHIVPVALLPFALPPGGLLAALCGLFAVSWLYLRRHPALGFGRRAITRIHWGADGKWLLTDAEGRKSEATLLPSSYVHPKLIVLNFKLNSGSKRTRIILGDEVVEEPLRALRARLLATRAANL